MPDKPMSVKVYEALLKFAELDMLEAAKYIIESGAIKDRWDIPLVGIVHSPNKTEMYLAECRNGFIVRGFYGL